MNTQTKTPALGGSRGSDKVKSTRSYYSSTALDAKQIKNAIDPRDFYEKRIDRLGKFGADGWADGGLCLWHDDKRPGSFKVNLSSGAYHCFSCGAHGDILNFAMQQDGADFINTLRNLAHEYGITPDNSPEARQRAKERALLAKAAQLEAVLLHELVALQLAIGNRVADRQLARDHKYRDAAIWFRPMPAEHWQREELAARRIHSLIEKLYPARMLERVA